MARYIDADALVSNFRKTKMDEVFPNWRELSCTTRAAIVRLTTKYRAIILSAPTIEARPVVRGEWLPSMFYTAVVGAKCSECNTTRGAKSNFCPSCGADMRGIEDA